MHDWQGPAEGSGGLSGRVRKGESSTVGRSCPHPARKSPHTAAMLGARAVLVLVMLLTLSPRCDAGKAPHGPLLRVGAQGRPVGEVRQETLVWSRDGAGGRRSNPLVGAGLHVPGCGERIETVARAGWLWQGQPQGYWCPGREGGHLGLLMAASSELGGHCMHQLCHRGRS